MVNMELSLIITIVGITLAINLTLSTIYYKYILNIINNINIKGNTFVHNYDHQINGIHNDIIFNIFE